MVLHFFCLRSIEGKYVICADLAAFGPYKNDWVPIFPNTRRKIVSMVGQNRKISSKEEPLRTLGLTSRPLYHIIMIVKKVSMNCSRSINIPANINNCKLRNYICLNSLSVERFSVVVSSLVISPELATGVENPDDESESDSLSFCPNGVWMRGTWTGLKSTERGT